jgi:hypothetical protein
MAYYSVRLKMPKSELLDFLCRFICFVVAVERWLTFFTKRFYIIHHTCSAVTCELQVTCLECLVKNVHLYMYTLLYSKFNCTYKMCF